jgi:hypothetical protein
MLPKSGDSFTTVAPATAGEEVIEHREIQRFSR